MRWLRCYIAKVGEATGKLAVTCVMQNKDTTREVSVPLHRELKPGIVRECIKKADLTEEDFWTQLSFF